MEALEKEILLQNFVKEIKSRSIEEEFEILEELTLLKTHKKRMNKEQSVAHLNRYIDILPCK